MTGGASVDGGLAALAGLAEMAVDCDVWRDRPLSQVVHELGDIIGFVRSERDPPSSPMTSVDQVQCRLPLG